MSVCLVTYVPYDAVLRCVEDIMQGYRQFHHTKTGGQMAWIDRQFLDDVLSQFPTELWQHIRFERA